MEDLDQRITELMESENLFAYLPLMYCRGLLRGEAQLPPLMNDRYPWIKPTTVEQYFATEKL